VRRPLVVVSVATAGLFAVASQSARADRPRRTDAVKDRAVSALHPDLKEVSKLTKEALLVSDKRASMGKNKLVGGYPLADDKGFALRFYWLAMQDRHDDDYDDEQEDIYTEDGFYLGTFADSFVHALRLEGSGLLNDGRVINYAGRCRYGVGTCFHELDKSTHPYGRGAGRRPLIPFKSVAIDPRVVPIGEPLYIPELDGLRMPDGSIHDGCVRADDTGGGIKKHKMDFFVVTYGNFRYLLREMTDAGWITPYIEDPRCDYLRQR